MPSFIRIYNREHIDKTLEELLFSIPDFKTKGRVLRLWSDVQPEDKPALFMIAGNQRREQSQNIPGTLLMRYDLYLYTWRSDVLSSDRQMMRLLDLIERKLDPGPGVPHQSLGISNVHHCYIAGEIETDEGSLGQDSVAIVPLEVLVA